MKVKLVLTHPDYPPYKKSFGEKDLSFDINDDEKTMWLGRRIILGVADFKPNKKIFMQWTSEKGKSRADRFCLPWYLIKPRQLILEDRRCECGNLILCRCHEKCVECGVTCKDQDYNRKVCRKLGQLAMSFLPQDNYDDEWENEIRDRLDGGDFRRSFIEDDDDEN